MPRFDAPFYGSKQWRNTRHKFLANHPMCQVDGCDQPSHHVDHKTARVDGGADFDEAGLEALCGSHHSAKTVAMDGGFGRAAVIGYRPLIRGSDASGAPKDKQHHWNRG
jgi:5-methylcytosine-specific restriction endonuclease McrA